MRNNTNKATLILFFTVLAVYAATSAPLVTPGDSGELAAAAFCLGIAHPPGYPLYVLVGKLFTFLPFGEVAYRLNLMSGVFMAVSAVLVYRISMTVSGGRGYAALSVAAAFALTGISWSQATYAEVYPLQLALSLASVYAAIAASEQDDARIALLSMLLLGLSVSAHFAGLIFLPAVVFQMLYKRPRGLTASRSAAGISLFVLGLTPFALLPVRAFSEPPMNWGDPDTIPRFIAHVTRSGYGDLSSMAASIAGGRAGAAIVVAFAAAVAALVVLGRGRFKGRLPSLLAWAVFVPSACLSAYLVVSGTTASKAGYFAHTLYGQGAAVFVPLALAGLWAAYHKGRGVFLAIALMTFVVAAVTIYRIPEPEMYNFQPLADKFFMPLMAALFVLAGAGAEYIAAAASKARPSLAYAGLALAVFPVWLLSANYRDMDKSDYYVAHDYGEALLRTLEQGSIFLADGDNQVFITMYNRIAGRQRLDVDAFGAVNSPLPPPGRARLAMADRRRPVYASIDKIQGLVLEQAGLLNRMPSAYNRPMPDYWSYYDIRLDPDRLGYLDFESKEMLAEFYFNWARDEASGGDMQKTLELLDQTVAVGRDIMWVNVGVANLFIEYELYDKSLALLKRAISLAPVNFEAYRTLGKYYIVTGDLPAAEDALSTAVKIKGNYPEALYMLAAVREARGDYEGALTAWQRYKDSGEGADLALAADRIKRLSEALRERRKSG